MKMYKTQTAGGIIDVEEKSGQMHHRKANKIPKCECKDAYNLEPFGGNNAAY